MVKSLGSVTSFKAKKALSIPPSDPTKKKQNPVKIELTGLNSGVGGNRTLVHTSNRKAFYMFSLHLVFENALTENRPHTP
jgi:hypothetical protein